MFNAALSIENESDEADSVSSISQMSRLRIFTDLPMIYSDLNSKIGLNI